MTADVPAEREIRGESTDSNRPAAPFDLGDSRDLAAAVRAAWADGPPDSPPRLEVPRPRLGSSEAADPLAQLRAGRPPRLGFRLPSLSTRPRPRTLAAGGVAVLALVVTAVVPIVGGATRLAPEAAERPVVRPTTTTSLYVAPTTAFTYPPETIVPPTPSTDAPAPDAVQASSSPPASAAPTATTSRPRTTTTARPAPKPTQAPAPTTTQAPPPPPEDGSGSEGSTEPPPYP